MKTIKDLKDKIKYLPDDMPVTMFYDGGAYTNNIAFRERMLWSNGEQKLFFVIDRGRGKD